MRQVSKVSIATVLCGVSMSVALAAQTYTNAQSGYRIAYPDGWSIYESKDKPGAVMGAAGAVGNFQERRICGVTTTASPASAGLSQAQINAELRAPFTDDFWKDASDNPKNLKILKSGSRTHPSSLAAREAEMSFEGTDGGPANMRMRLSVMASPGTIYALICMAEVRAYGTYGAELSAVIESFRHNQGLDSTVNAMPDAGAIPVSAKMPEWNLQMTKAAASAAAEVEARFKK